MWLPFSFTDAIVTRGFQTLAYMTPYMVSSCVLLIFVPSIRCACPCDVAVEVTGFNISDIPRNLRSDLDYLIISRTNIRTLNLTVAVEYPKMCRLDISRSPFNRIITPGTMHDVALVSLRLTGGYFPTLPDLGEILEGQAEYVSFYGMGIITISDNYFINFIRLISLILANNPISNLNAANMAGLSHLHDIYLGNTQINPMPPLHQWLPNLRRLHVPRNGISLLPADLVEHLPNLVYLNVQGNELITVPSRKHFVNLKYMVFVNLKGNPLHCDTQLCWLKVTNIHNNDVGILTMIITDSSISWPLPMPISGSFY